MGLISKAVGKGIVGCALFVPAADDDTDEHTAEGDRDEPDGEARPTADGPFSGTRDAGQ